MDHQYRWRSYPTKTTKEMFKKMQTMPEFTPSKIRELFETLLESDIVRIKI
jgi:hypothetical protein